MRVKKGIVTTALLILVLGTFSNLVARTASDIVDNKAFNQSKATAPAHCLAAHRVGKMGLAVTNSGTIGKGFFPGADVDFFTGEAISYSCEYPRGSNTEYLYAATLWIGAIVGNDTLVSVGADGWNPGVKEMFPDAAPFGYMIKRTTGDPDAVSHEDYISVYTDTLTDGVPVDWSGRPHIPLDVEITQSSYAWSHPWTEDFILIEYRVKNIGVEQLNQVYVGFYVDADICFDCNGPMQGFADDLSGFLQTYPTQFGNCEFLDTINIAWSADNNGDLNRPIPAPHVTGLAPIGNPYDDMQYNFNWWVSNGNPSLDFGPRLRPTAEDPWRDFGTGGGIGTPEGDVNKYYIMRHPEFDYDQAYTATIPTDDPNWIYPNQAVAGDIADGFDTRYLLSYGPFDISPGQTLPITIAYVGGQGFHTVEDNLQNLPDNPDAYYSNLDFSDLALNARWAGWVYDNPGVDTDLDGYSGKFRVCCDGEVCDTTWYEGDGVPDFDASPSLAGQDMVWVESREEALWVRWNGLHAETQEDLVTGQVDFEGYRVYLSPDGTPGSYAEVESYDIDDYLKYTYSPQWGWELREYPLTLEELRCLYADSCGDATFDPAQYNYSAPYVHPDFPDSVFYFEPFDLNKSEFGITTQILKRYPGQPYPSSLDTSLVDPSELTADGFLKYFEYELTIGNLLAGECYWVSVTRTDFGAPQFGLPGEESDLSDGDHSECTWPPGDYYTHRAGWDLMSAPVELDSPLPSDVFGDHLPFWQIYGWDGAGYYVPLEIEGCGSGYWLYSPERVRFAYDGTECTPLEPPICVAVNSGWNLLGSPYHRGEILDGVFLDDALYHAQGETVSFNEALSRGWIAEWMYTWTSSGYREDNYIGPGRSCWFASFIDDLEVCLYPNGLLSARKPAHDPFAAGSVQTMTISLLGTSESVNLGLHEQATAGFDSEYDMPSPPPAPGATAGLVIVSTNNPLWKQLRTDVRPLEDEITWHFNVTGTGVGELEFNNVSSLTQHGYSISLVDSRSQIMSAIEDDRTVRIDPGDYSLVANRSGAYSSQIPSDYVLADNYPNPFNPSTMIRFGLPASGQVRMAVYNLLGQRVATLVDGFKSAGWHEVSWNGCNDDGSAVSSGIYFYRLETDEFIQSRKMLLIK